LLRGSGLRKLERAFLAAARRRHGAGERECCDGGAYHFRIMTESEFHSAVDAVLARIESSLEDEEDLDVDLESTILTITGADGSKIIVNRQTPNREIWVAARSGGFHFRSRGGEWRDTRSDEELFACLGRVIASQSGVHARWK
jgi:CyaY protein